MPEISLVLNYYCINLRAESAHMNILKHYSIPWKGLKNGAHHFDFEVDDRFFKAFEESGILGGNAKVSVNMEKSATMLMLDFSITGTVTVECDRCLEDLALPVDYSGALKVKFSDEIEDYDGEVMWINPADGELQLGQYIYESILLSLPYQKIHGDDPDGSQLCNPEMLSRFSIISGEEFDDMTADTEVLEDSPEAEKLRHLKEKLEKEDINL